MRSSASACNGAGKAVKRGRKSPWTAFLLSLVLLLCAQAAPLVSDEAVYAFETQELWTERDGKRIYGVLYVPQGTGDRMPALLCSHGFGGSWRSCAQYAGAMAARGYVVYCFDFCGGSPGSRSDGTTLEMSVFTEQADLEAVLAMAQGLDFVDPDRIFLLGTSQGGAVSAITAAEHADEIRGLILLYPAFVLVDNANEMDSSPEGIPESTFFLWMEVLLLHGDADDIVPLSYSERALEVYPEARLQVLPGAGHGFYGEDAQVAIDAIADYCNAWV